LENEEKFAAQLIADKAAQKQLTARQTVNRTQATRKRDNSTMPTPAGHAIIGQKRKKVSYI